MESRAKGMRKIGTSGAKRLAYGAVGRQVVCFRTSTTCYKASKENVVVVFAYYIPSKETKHGQSAREHRERERESKFMVI